MNKFLSAGAASGANYTTRGFQAVSAGALEVQTVAHTALKKW